MENYETGERIKTPRGTFTVLSLTTDEMEEAGYGYHHSSENGEYRIMANGKYAYAIKKN